ncbi:hypothetical protein BJ508DRAFT_307074 [Ascobolus immersus RN42]|uniref:C2H2-type domain-containing protein n=1 Tax=Ascobolus immersus RN42 TaxID=1160509 RepID=A0A3N4I429_ASCIM|nr:hypothetical protein BJ508DRAFT_307074 [Ascobolus immersus RN42]
MAKPFLYACEFCDTKFNDPVERNTHLEDVHDKIAWVQYPSVYFRPDGDWLGGVYVKRSKDTELYCVVEECDFHTKEKEAFQYHCTHHKPPLAFRSSPEVGRKVEYHRNVTISYYYERILPAPVGTQDSTIEEELGHADASHGTTQKVNLESETETGSDSDSNSETGSDSDSDSTPSGNKAAVPPSVGFAGRRLSPHAVDVRTAQKTAPISAKTRNSSKSGETGWNNSMIVSLRAEYRKAVFQESMRTLADPSANLEESSERNEKLKAYFLESVRILEEDA